MTNWSGSSPISPSMHSSPSTAPNKTNPILTLPPRQINLHFNEAPITASHNLPPRSRPSPPSPALHGRVTTPAPAALHRIQDSPNPVLEQVRNVAEGVAVREEVPSAGSVPVIVEPRAKDEICGSEQEDPDKNTCKLANQVPRDHDNDQSKPTK